MLGEHKAGSNEYARYKISMPPEEEGRQQVQEPGQEGYSITNAGGSGGGWGGYGGSDYGMTAKKGDAYREVQAGGESRGAHLLRSVRECQQLPRWAGPL